MNIHGFEGSHIAIDDCFLLIQHMVSNIWCLILIQQQQVRSRIGPGPSIREQIEELQNARCASGEFRIQEHGQDGAGQSVEKTGNNRQEQRYQHCQTEIEFLWLPSRCQA
jgi:hypothetical protein